MNLDHRPWQNEVVYAMKSYLSDDMKVPSPFVTYYISTISTCTHGIVARTLLQYLVICHLSCEVATLQARNSATQWPHLPEVKSKSETSWREYPKTDHSKGLFLSYPQTSSYNASDEYMSLSPLNPKGCNDIQWRPKDRTNGCPKRQIKSSRTRDPSFLAWRR